MPRRFANSFNIVSSIVGIRMLIASESAARGGPSGSSTQPVEGGSLGFQRAASSAISLLVHYPEYEELVSKMAELVREE